MRVLASHLCSLGLSPEDGVRSGLNCVCISFFLAGLIVIDSRFFPPVF